MDETLQVTLTVVKCTYFCMRVTDNGVCDYHSSCFCWCLYVCYINDTSGPINGSSLRWERKSCTDCSYLLMEESWYVNIMAHMHIVHHTVHCVRTAHKCWHIDIAKYGNTLYIGMAMV